MKKISASQDHKTEYKKKFIYRKFLNLFLKLRLNFYKILTALFFPKEMK